jgi:hypothetical protein
MPLSLVALSLALDFQFLFQEYHDLNFVWQQFVEKKNTIRDSWFYREHEKTTSTNVI